MKKQTLSKSVTASKNSSTGPVATNVLGDQLDQNAAPLLSLQFLRGIKITGWIGPATYGGPYIIEAKSVMPPPHCPKCGLEAVSKGRAGAAYGDVPIGVNPVVIILNFRRWYCSNCRRQVPALPSPDIHPNYRFTNRFVVFMAIRGLERPFAEVARQCGVSETTVRKIATQAGARLMKLFPPAADESISLDDLHLSSGKYTVVTVLPENDK